MGALLFTIYLLVGCWLIYRNRFLQKTGVNMRWLIGLYVTKVLAGVAYGYLFTKLPNYATHSDTWRFFYAAVEEKKWLMEQPMAWLADVYQPRYANDSGILGTHNSLLNDLKDVLVVKLMTLCNLVSGNRYYVNLIFFNYLFLFGQVALALVWTKVFQLKQAGIMLVAVCLWPSVLFWSSGFHRDGILLHCLGWVLWIGYTIWESKQILFRQVLMLVLCLGFIFLFRNYVALLLTAAMAVGFAVAKWKRYALPIAVGSVVLAIAGLMGMGIVNSSYQLPMVLMQRQAEFLLLEGQSKIPAIMLDGSWGQWLTQLPKALLNALLVPPAHVGWTLKDLPFILENLVWLLCLFPAVRYVKKQMQSGASIAFFTCVVWLSLALLCIIGYTIPFASAIVRYKSLIWPLMAPCVVYWGYDKLKHWLPVLRNNV